MWLYEAAGSYCPAEPLTREKARARSSIDRRLSFPFNPAARRISSGPA
jgi:hypothetical protein